MEQAQIRRPRGQTYGVLTRFDAVAAGFEPVQVDTGVIEEGVHDADGVRTTADASANRIRMVDAVDVLELFLGLLADNLLEVTHDGWERVRPADRAEQVMRGLHVGDPVSQRFVDGVLENTRSLSYFDNLGTKQPHTRHVQRLAAGIDLTHVDAALEAEQCADRCGRDTVLTGAGLRDDAGLAHALDQQRLAQRVVDFVGTGVVEVLTLEEDTGVESGLLVESFGEARRLGEFRRTADILFVEPLELCLERRIGFGFVVDALELVQRPNQRLRNESATVLAEIRALML